MRVRIVEVLLKMSLAIILVSFALCAVIYAVEGFHLPEAVEPCGVEASPYLIHHNPWLVFLEYYRRGGLVDIRCGATLVGKRHVVTAAHCVKIKADMYKVRLGEYDLRTKEDCFQGICTEEAKTIDVIDVTIHPDYTGAGHDIAVLTLASDAPYTDFIRPICLPSAPASNATFVSTGWGEVPKTNEYSQVKKIIPLPQWDDTKCRSAYSHTNLPDDVICAGGKEGIDTCRGDSGGPLVQYKGKAELAGVTSKGFVICGTEGKPGIYTSVFEYVDWIKEVMDRV